MSVLDFETLTLASGSHNSFEAGACLLEAASYLAGEPWSDHPECVSPVLGSYGRSLNDTLPSDRRQELKKYLPELLNTAGDGQDVARSYMALDWLVRTYTPAFLDVAGLMVEAQSLRDLRPVVDLVTADFAGPVVRAARQKAVVAGDAAWDAAGDAARDVAGEVLQPAVALLQTSAIELLGHMINPSPATR